MTLVCLGAPASSVSSEKAHSILILGIMVQVCIKIVMTETTFLTFSFVIYFSVELVNFFTVDLSKLIKPNFSSKFQH